MNLFRKRLGEKGLTVSSSESSSHFYCFVSSGNPTLIREFHNQFLLKAHAYCGSAGQYSVSLRLLEDLEREAMKLSLPFVGYNYKPGQRAIDPLESTPVRHLHEVLNDIRMGALGDTHVAFVSVNSKGLSSIQSIYKILRHGARAQNIFCNRLHITEDKEAADQLLSTFEKGS